MQLPDDLVARPFTRAEALALGVTAKQLRSSRFRSVFRGVYVVAELLVTTMVRARAALLLAPSGAVLSHHTALAMWGLELPGRHPIHVSTRTGWHSRQPGIVSHRRAAPIAARERSGLPLTSAERTFVDLGTHLPWVWLIVVGDWLVQQRLTTMESLIRYASERHLSGVRRARRALRWVRDSAESPMETIVRLMLVFARLPEPACNAVIRDGEGRFVARVELAYLAWRVAVEYDGRWHERTAQQRVRDRDRRERLERLGWVVVVVYDSDLREPERVPWRVFHALRNQGFLGAPPTTSVMWTRWFGSSNLWPVSAPAAAAYGPQLAKSWGRGTSRAGGARGGWGG